MNSPDTLAKRQSALRSWDDLACPNCAGSIRHEGSELTCTTCSITFPIRDDIADLRCRRYDYYFNPIPREEMKALTREAQFQPWERTIHRFLKGVRQNPDWFDDLVVNGRYAWKLLLRLPENAKVLDLGCGLGNLVRNVAPNVGSVDALDLTIERLQFAQLRFKRFNATDDIRLLAGGDGTHLPFPADSFDCVTLSGVLEWVAADAAIWSRMDTRTGRAAAAFLSFFGASNPRKTQIRFLNEIHRVLKPDGQLFIAIENRTSYCYFGGRRDHHSGLWFGSLLPRFIANIYSMWARRSPYRTYTYSINGLRRLLKTAEFPNTEFYGLTPGYTQLAELLPLRTENQLWQPPAPPGLNRIKRSRHFVPAYGVIASKGRPERRSLAELVAGSLAEQLGANSAAVCFTRFVVTDKDKGVIAAEIDGRSIVLKVPFGDAITARAARNYHFLEQPRDRGGLTELIPNPVGTGVIRGIRYYAEERVPGQPLQRALTTLGATTWFGAASRFLEALNPTLPDCGLQHLSGELYQRQVREPLALVERVTDASLAVRLQSYFESQLSGMAARFGITHGDFSASNIFIRGESVVGVVDWDDSSQAGLPVLDALNLVDSAYRHLNRPRHVVESISRLSDLTALADHERQFLQSNYDRCGIDIKHHSMLVLLYWLRHVADQLDGNLIYDKPRIDKRITAVLEKLLVLNGASRS